MFGEDLHNFIGHFQSGQCSEKVLDLSLAVGYVFVEDGTILGMIDVEWSVTERMNAR